MNGYIVDQGVLIYNPSSMWQESKVPLLWMTHSLINNYSRFIHHGKEEDGRVFCMHTWVHRKSLFTFLLTVEVRYTGWLFHQLILRQKELVMVKRFLVAVLALCAGILSSSAAFAAPQLSDCTVIQATQGKLIMSCPFTWSGWTYGDSSDMLFTTFQDGGINLDAAQQQALLARTFIKVFVQPTDQTGMQAFITMEARDSAAYIAQNNAASLDGALRANAFTFIQINGQPAYYQWYAEPTIKVHDLYIVYPGAATSILASVVANDSWWSQNSLMGFQMAASLRFDPQPRDDAAISTMMSSLGLSTTQVTSTPVPATPSGLGGLGGGMGGLLGAPGTPPATHQATPLVTSTPTSTGIAS